MLIPDDEGVLHIAILTETSPPVTRDIAADVQLNLYTKYVIVCFQVLKTKAEIERSTLLHLPQFFHQQICYTHNFLLY